jgi:hypothetical protein
LAGLIEARASRIDAAPSPAAAVLTNSCYLIDAFVEFQRTSPKFEMVLFQASS